MVGLSLQYSALHCTALHCAALHCTVIHCTALQYTTLHCTAIHYTALHCTTLQSPALSFFVGLPVRQLAGLHHPLQVTTLTLHSPSGQSHCTQCTQCTQCTVYTVYTVYSVHGVHSVQFTVVYSVQYSPNLPYSKRVGLLMAALPIWLTLETGRSQGN